MKQLFLDQDSADISFEVGDQIFFAHKLVLRTCAKRSILASLCDDCDISSSVPISSDLDPKVFRLMLFHVYGGEISSDVWQDHSKEMLEAADKYGLSNLKIEAEGWYVKTLSLSTENAVEVLAYAIDMNCFLLKEVANKFIKDHSKEILSSDSGKMIRGRKTLMSDVLDVLVTGEDNLIQPHINTLRIELDRQGKEFDGSRELLIARLQEGKDDSLIDVAKDVIRKG
jgi:speckle-type POZ protein